jgi:hypothetical protein
MPFFTRKFDPYMGLLLALSLFAWGPLLTPAYFLKAHDARHSLFYLVEFVQTLRDGYLWPRWSPDFAFGYGYPLFNIYAPLALYAAALLHLLGLSLTTAVKAMYVLATVGAGLGMYGFVRRLWGREAGLLAGVVYIYAPFHLAEIFVRSAYAEYVSLALVPFIFWAFTALLAAPTPRRVAVAGFAYGLLALTHHTSFFTFSPFLMIYILYLLWRPPLPLATEGRGPATVGRRVPLGDRRKGAGDRREEGLLRPALVALGAGLLGVALAAIYLIPLVAEMRYVKMEQWTSGSYNYLQHFVYFSQFFAPAWGYGYAGAGLQDEFSYQLGVVPLALLGLALVVIPGRRGPHDGVARFFLIATLVVVLLMSPWAESVWRAVSLATLVQFPWRLLGMTAFTLAVVAGSLLSAAPAKIENPLLLLVVILASYPYTLPQYTPVPDWAETPLAVIYWDRESITDRVGMMAVTEEQPQDSPMLPQYLAGEPLPVAGVITGSGTVETLHRGGASSRVRVRAEGPVAVQFYTYDYPGWQVTRDGQPLAHRPEPPFGLITVDLPAGDHILLLYMGTTFPRTLGAILSGLALVIITALLLKDTEAPAEFRCPFRSSYGRQTPP